MENSKSMKIREYKFGDHKEIADLFYETVHTVNAKDYNSKQLYAWAPQVINYEKWEKRCKKKNPLLVIKSEKIIGFAEFEENGHIDCFYVHKNFQRKGIGTLLLEFILNKAKQEKIKKVYAEVSITAKAFFEKHDFKLVKKNIVKINDQELINFLMERKI